MKVSMLPAWLLTRSRSLSFTTSEPKFCCRSVMHLARPALQQLHVLRDTAEQQADLLQDQRVEQQGEQQHHRPAGPGSSAGPRCRAASRAGSAAWSAGRAHRRCRRRDERRQDRGEQLQRRASDAPPAARPPAPPAGRAASPWPRRAPAGARPARRRLGRRAAAPGSLGHRRPDRRSRHRPRRSPAWWRDQPDQRRTPPARPDRSRTAAAHRDQHDLQRRVKLRDVERADQHGLAEQGQHHDAAHDHHVAEHHQDGQPVRQHPHRREGHIHRHQQRLVGDRIEQRSDARCRRRCAAPASRRPRRTAPAATNRKKAGRTGAPAPARPTAARRRAGAKVMTLGSVSSVVGRASADLRSVRHPPAFPRLHALRCAERQAHGCFRHRPVQRTKPVAYRGPP